MSDEAAFWRMEAQRHLAYERVMLPRLGRHFSAWGSGHTCDSDGPHEGRCVCECGIVQPYDEGMEARKDRGVGTPRTHQAVQEAAMIKAAGKTGLGVPLLFLGLSGENVTRLAAGEPIRIEASQMAALSMPQLEIIIHYGRTESAILDELKARGIALASVSNAPE